MFFDLKNALDRFAERERFLNWRQRRIRLFFLLPTHCPVEGADACGNEQRRAGLW